MDSVQNNFLIKNKQLYSLCDVLVILFVVYFCINKKTKTVLKINVCVKLSFSLLRSAVITEEELKTFKTVSALHADY